jgi:hypothetical protein
MERQMPRESAGSQSVRGRSVPDQEKHHARVDHERDAGKDRGE